MMAEETGFYQKNGLIVMRLARDLYTMEPGQYMDTIANYAEQTRVGRGTIQKAIAHLVDSGTVSLSKQGHKGTMVTGLDRDRLWEMTGWNTLFVACPIPMGKDLTSMIGAVDYALRKSGVPYTLGFSTATHNRLGSLNAGRYSATLTSALGVSSSEGLYPNVEVAVALKGCVYGDPYGLIYNACESSAPWRGMRVAIFIRSAEQMFLAKELEKRYSIKTVQLTSSEAMAALRNGQVDGLLGRLSTVRAALRSKSQSFNFHVLDLAFLGHTEEERMPLLTVNKTNYGLSKLIQRVFVPSEVEKYQRQILSGELETLFF